MILPPGSVAAGTATPTAPDRVVAVATGLPDFQNSENWSSLIGIVTAIVGNIMISFALNMQRYAHIRLDREWQEKERQRKKRGANGGRDSWQAGENRSLSKRKYHAPRLGDYADEQERVGRGATETDPLIPTVPEEANEDATSDTGAGQDSVDGGGAGPEAGGYKQKSYLKSPYWWAGIILMTTGEAGNFLAYGFAPASIVSPLGVVALISNCIIAPIMLKEPFRKRDALGVIIAVAGAVTVVASASDNNPKLGPGEIWDLITTWEFETYLGITILVIVGLLFASNRFGDKSILIDLGLVGLFGGYTALSTKGVASMLSYTLWRAITFPVTYLLVAILVGTAVMQIKYVNRALQRFDATQVIPVQFVLFTLSVILGSAILYRDFERTSGGNAGKFVGGCVLTFLGVWCITSGRARQNEDEEDREPEPEDAINLHDGEHYHDEVDATADQDASAGSRRASTFRASSPPIAINTRVSSRHSSHQATPDIITPTPDDSRPLPRTPTTTSEGIPSIPASLTNNPWEADDSSSFPLTRPPPLSRQTTTSIPAERHTELLQRAASTSSPELISHPLPQPRTPTRGISDNQISRPVTPGTTGTLPSRLRRTGTAERAGASLQRNSIPGPLLASPLSTGLSAMVANLKRGGSLRGAQHLTSSLSSAQHYNNDGSVRRRESVLGIEASEIAETEEEQQEGNMGAGMGEPLDRRRTTTEQSGVGQTRAQIQGKSQDGRVRSLSGTLTDLWRGMRRGGENGEGAGTDEESGRGALAQQQQRG